MLTVFSVPFSSSFYTFLRESCKKICLHLQLPSKPLHSYFIIIIRSTLTKAQFNFNIIFLLPSILFLECGGGSFLSWKWYGQTIILLQDNMHGSIERKEQCDLYSIPLYSFLTLPYTILFSMRFYFRKKDLRFYWRCSDVVKKETASIGERHIIIQHYISVCFLTVSDRHNEAPSAKMYYFLLNYFHFIILYYHHQRHSHCHCFNKMTKVNGCIAMLHEWTLSSTVLFFTAALRPGTGRAWPQFRIA